MRLEHYPKKKFKGDVLEIVGKYLDLKKYKVFIFGSRVSGKGNDKSDIDVGIEGPEKIPDSVISGIKDEVENLPILYKIDIINFTDVDKNFLEVASQYKEYIN